MSSKENYAELIKLACLGKLALLPLVDAASSLEAADEVELAVVLYQAWLAHNSSEFAHLVEFNLGSSMTKIGWHELAEPAYLRAIAGAPRFMQPRVNLGSLYERQGRVAEAIAQWRAVADMPEPGLQDLPMVVMALNHLGRVLEAQKDYQESLAALSRSLRLEPKQPDVLHHWVFVRQRMCAWPIYEPVPGVTVAEMRAATSALAMIGLTDDPAQQLAAARHYVEGKLRTDLTQLSSRRSYGHRRLRIGYCSSDLCLHPVAMLIVQMLELHDREHFEVFIYCWTREDGSALRERVKRSCDQFFRIDQLDDLAAARLIHSHEIDVLVDLQGQTAGARPNILEQRPAPLQITYLGLPATTAFPQIDLVIADRFLIPEETRQFFSEEPLYMPDIYMVSDRKRTSAAPPSRQECGLPAESFVFCSFNNSFKYTPEIFQAWLQILEQVPGSVLWLLADNCWAEANLRTAAATRGLEGRLVFAQRTSPEKYLSRYQLADLFLDTFPFNAGTTANDCLWMGCPLLTLTGRAFAARMAGAMLSAAGLPELITYDLAEYVDRAVKLAHDTRRRADIRAHLREVREHGVLFDTVRFTRQLESELLRLSAALPAAEK